MRNAGSAGSNFLPRVQKTARPVHSSVMVITGVCPVYFSSVSDLHRRDCGGKNTTSYMYFKGENTEPVEKG